MNLGPGPSFYSSQNSRSGKQEKSEVETAQAFSTDGVENVISEMTNKFAHELLSEVPSAEFAFFASLPYKIKICIGVNKAELKSTTC